MKTIKLQSSDDEIFDVDVEILKCSGTIKTMIQDGDNAVIPLPKVNSATLRKVLQWADFHKDDPKPVAVKEKRTDDIPSWDVEFLKVDRDILFSLLNAASDLDIKGLLNSGCKTVANMITKKTVEEIRQMFNIPRRSTEE